MRYNVVMDATKPTSLRIPDEIIAFAEEIAKAKEWSRAKVLVRSIECGLPLVGDWTLKGYQQNHDQAEANLIKAVRNNAEIATGGSAGVAAAGISPEGKRGVQKGVAGDHGKLLRGQSVSGVAAPEGKFRGSGKCPHGWVDWMTCRNNGGGCE